MAFHFSNDVFRQNFTFESTERILYRFALLQSNFCHATPLNQITASLISDASYRQFACHGGNSDKPRKYELLANVIAGSEFLVCICFIRAEIERSLLRRVLAKFSHLVHAARNGFLLLPLILSLCFVPLSLLPRVLFLALSECRSASWHLIPLTSVCFSPTGIWQPNRT